MKKLLLSLMALVVAIGASAATKTDVLNQSVTGVTGTSYTAFSDKQVTSKAVYAGQCAGGNASIQLRSNNNNSGVITTESGGKVRKVTVTWNSSTAEGRTLNIYGSNDAYTAATDLYGDNAGTLLGTIVCGTSTELEITDDYEYVGFRSASGAMYLSEVQIEWEVEGSTKKDVVVEFSGKDSYIVFVGEQFPFPQAYVKDGDDILDNVIVTYTISNEEIATIIGYNEARAPIAMISAPGQFTIKATFGGNDTYEEASASISFTAYYKFESIAEILELEPAGQKAALKLDNAVITDIYVTKAGKRNGIYIQDESTEETIEIFCYDVPESWEVGGIVSGTVFGDWKIYNGTKEICPSNWDGLTYTPVFFITYDRIINQGYTAEQVEYDEEAVLAALGIESLDGVQFYAINQTTGEWILYTGTSTALGNSDGWLNSEGDVTLWGQDSYVCLKFPQGGSMALCTMPGNEPAVDTQYTAQWAIVSGDNAVLLDVTINFIEAPAVELTLSENVYSTAAVEYTTEDGDYYELVVALSDETIAAICEELDIHGIADAVAYGYNPTTQEVVSAYAAYDGWRDANGDFATWAGNLTVPFCVKYTDGINYYCYNIKHSEPTSYKAYWILANEQTMKGVLVEIPVKFDFPTAINSLAASKKASVIYNAAGQLLSAPQKGINIIDGKKVYVK